jgi:uncharacterized protein involved in copper resistance
MNMDGMDHAAMEHDAVDHSAMNHADTDAAPTTTATQAKTTDAPAEVNRAMLRGHGLSQDIKPFFGETPVVTSPDTLERTAQ